jgi:hypothetical protein
VHLDQGAAQGRGHDGLQRAANGFYGVPEAEYDRSIGLNGLLRVRRRPR